MTVNLRLPTPLYILYNHETYSTIKKEILPFVTTQMNPKDFTPSETGQTWEDKYQVISLLYEI